MLSSNKIAAFLLSFYLAFAIIPGLVADFVMLTPDPVRTAVISCVLFISGFLIASFFLPIKQKFSSMPDHPSIVRGFKIMVLILLMLTVYIVVAGPTPPIVGLVTSSDPLLAMQIREDALKLNQNLLFVRIYSWSRDIIAPIVFIFALGLWRFRKSTIGRKWIFASLSLSLFVGLWSGQKATVINYIIAALFFLSSSLKDLVKNVLRALPIAASLILLIFVFTSAKFSSSGQSEMLTILGDIWTGIVYRIFVAPMEVAGAYVDAADNLRIINPIDVIFPLFNRLLTPDLAPAENRISIEYFYREGLESGIANAPAFAYAYVVGGQFASFLAGGFVFVSLWLATSVVRATRSPFAIITFEANLAYVILDLVNSNFIHYSFKIVITSIVVMVVTIFFRKKSLLRSEAQLTPGSAIS